MIDDVFEFLRAQLNSYLGQRFSLDDNLVVLDSPTAGNITDKLVLTLVNIEREVMAQSTTRAGFGAPIDGLRRPQTLDLNLVFMVSSNFPDNYKEGLKVLSAAIAFFQSLPVFDHETSPDLPPDISRLRVQWQDVDLQSTHRVWTIHGGTYRPSAVYKAGMLIVSDELVTQSDAEDGV